MSVRAVTADDVASWCALRAALWPEADRDALRAEADAYFAGSGLLSAVFLWQSPGGQVCGMIELSLRPYADGCDSSPVPYVEGWYVIPAARGHGIGRALMEAAQEWARAQGHRRNGVGCADHQRSQRSGTPGARLRRSRARDSSTQSSAAIVVRTVHARRRGGIEPAPRPNVLAFGCRYWVRRRHHPRRGGPGGGSGSAGVSGTGAGAAGWAASSGSRAAGGSGCGSGAGGVLGSGAASAMGGVSATGGRVSVCSRAISSGKRSARRFHGQSYASPGPSIRRGGGGAL